LDSLIKLVGSLKTNTPSRHHFWPIVYTHIYHRAGTKKRHLKNTLVCFQSMFYTHLIILV